MKTLQPPDWLAPRGYANGILTEMTVGSRLVFVGGQIGWNGQQQFESDDRSEEHTSELQSHSDLVCRLLLEKKKKMRKQARRQRVGGRSANDWSIDAW